MMVTPEEQLVLTAGYQPSIPLALYCTYCTITRLLFMFSCDA